MEQTTRRAPRNNNGNKITYNRLAPRKNDTLVYALGGLGEVGKNMYCIEHEDEIVIIDAGVRFPEENLLGVDYVIPDYSYLVRNKQKRKVLIITHGHEDHIGGIPFLLKSVAIEKIYAPRFAVALINRKLEEKKMLKAVKIEEINEDSVVQTKFFPPSAAGAPTRRPWPSRPSCTRTNVRSTPTSRAFTPRTRAKSRTRGSWMK